MKNLLVVSRTRIACTLVVCLAAAAPLVACGSAETDTTELAAPASLDRVRIVDTDLALAPEPGSGGLEPQDLTPGSSAFTYVAVVSPPRTKDGRTVQATNFTFDNRYAYVVYNMAGNEVAGALDVVDLADPKAPRVVSSLFFPDAEFSDVAVRGNRAYLAGVRADGAVGAALKVVSIQDPKKPSLVRTVDLPGQYATSISTGSDGTFVTTGLEGGLISLDLGRSDDPRISSNITVPNALSGVKNRGTTYVLGGESSTQLFRVQGSNASVLQTVGAVPVAAPGRITLVGDVLYTNAGTNGLRGVDLRSDAAPLVHSSELSGLGNGITNGDGYLFLAQGDHTRVYDVSVPTAPRSLGRFAFTDDDQSANQVRHGKIGNSSYVFVGNGNGGFRIVRFAAP